MVDLKSRINKLKSSGLNDDEKLCKLAYIYRKTFGLTNEELMKEPIPVVMSNAKMIMEEHKKNKKGFKGKGAKHG